MILQKDAIAIVKQTMDFDAQFQTENQLARPYVGMGSESHSMSIAMMGIHWMAMVVMMIVL